VLRQRGVVYDVGRAMGALSANWRPDYSPALMRREMDIIRADLHANAVRLGGRDPRRLLAAAEYAASIGLEVWIGPELWNATPLLGSQLPVIRRHIRPRVRAVHPRDEQVQAGLLIDQLELLDQAGVDGAFVMSFSFPLAPYGEDPRHDIDATALSIVRTLPRGEHGTTYPGVGWEPKEAFRAIARYYRQQEPR
jgi:hypothetical protein